MENKKVIIHMVNGEEYHIKESENFNKKNSYSLDEFEEAVSNVPTPFTRVSKESGYEITYVSRFAIKQVEEVTLRLESISSIDLV